MKVTQHPDLAGYNSFGLKASAGLLLQIDREEDVLDLPGFNPQRDFILGGGSNVVFVDDVPGCVLLNRIAGIHLLEEDRHHSLIEVGAGENWHQLVAWCVDHGYSGLENLALIPGLAGAAPIQNIGAYGVELSARLVSVTAWDWQRAQWVVLDRQQCRFAYRDSLFKSIAPGRYLITSLRLQLDRTFTPQLDYAGIRQELQQAGIEQADLRDVFNAIIWIRQRKLPDPAVQGNAGSFFKNPVVSRERFETLLSQYPDLPSWPLDDDRHKLSAAWMIEQCGLKGYRQDGVAVSSQHALVLVNEGGASGAQVWRLAMHVRQQVLSGFDIELEPEPTIYFSDAAG